MPFETTAPFLPFTRTTDRFDEDEENGSADESDLEFDSYPLAEQTRFDRIKALEQAVSVRPEDANAWLEYSTAHLANKARHTPSSAAVAIAILDKALAVPANTASAPLHLAYLRTAAEIWSGDKLAARWTDVLNHFPIVMNGQLLKRSADVWLEYLGWCEGAGLAVVGHDERRGFAAVSGIYEKVIRDIRATVLAGGGMW